MGSGNATISVLILASLNHAFCFNEQCGADADMEDYGFEYSDEEPEEQDVDIENQYYNSKGSIISPIPTVFVLFWRNLTYFIALSLHNSVYDLSSMLFFSFWNSKGFGCVLALTYMRL